MTTVARRKTKIEKLESLRGFAAVYVLLSHASSNALHWQHRWYGQPFRYAQEGVLIFFLLSGFVIFYSWEQTRSQRNFGHYFYKRFRRIYPVFCFALLLTYALACLAAGRLVNPNLAGAAENLLMLQGFESDPGWQVTAYMGNGPLWSLSYEWWFYMMFYPIYRWVPVVWQKYVVLALALAGIIGSHWSPNLLFHILGSFPLWWCGVEFAREYLASGQFSPRRQIGTLGVLAATGVAYGGITWAWHQHGGPLVAVDYPLVKLRHCLAALGMILIFYVWRRTGFRGFSWTLGPFGALAGISYAIYALHFPVLLQWRVSAYPAFAFMEIVARIILVFFLAWFAETLWQRFCGHWLDRWYDRLRFHPVQPADAGGR